MSDLLNNRNDSSEDISALITRQSEEAQSFIEQQQDRLEKLERLVSNEIDGIHDSIKGWSQFESKVRELHETVESEAVQLEHSRKEIEELKRTVEANETEQLAQLDAERRQSLQDCNELKKSLTTESEERKQLVEKLDEANAIVKDSDVRIGELQDQVATLESEVARHKEAALKSQSEIASLNSKIDDAVESRKTLESDFEKLRGQMQEATDWLADREQQISNLESQIDEYQSDAERYRNQYELEAEALKKARSERDALRANISSESSEGKQLRAMLNEATASLNAQEHKTEEYQKKAAECESEAESLRKKLARMSDELAELKSDAIAIKEDRDGLKTDARAAVEERDKKIALLKSQLSEVSDGGGADSQRIREENAELLAQLEKAASAVKKARSERDMLKEELANGGGGDGGARLREATERLEDREEEIQRLNDQIADLSSGSNGSGGVDDQEFAELKKRFEAAATKVGQLKTLNQQLEDELASAREGGGGLTKDVETSYEKRIRAAEVEISLERAQNARAQTELKEKLRELEFQFSKGGGGGGASSDFHSEPPRKKPRSLRESMGLD